jgi:hypothetical protein
LTIDGNLACLNKPEHPRQRGEGSLEGKVLGKFGGGSLDTQGKPSRKAAEIYRQIPPKVSPLPQRGEAREI